MLKTLEKKTVMIAGGAGFVGSALVREVLKEGAKIIVYDNFLHGVKENLDEIEDQITIVSGDILDEWKLTETFKKYRIEYVFDLVGDTYVPTSYEVPKRFFNINVLGTLNLLMASKFFNVKRILYVSSTEVYGEALTEKIDEKHPLNPKNTYAVSKLAADRLCYTYHKEHNIPVVIARIFNCFGPRESEPYVIPEIITQLSKGIAVRLGNIKARRDFTYVTDTCKALIAVLKSDIPNGDIMNIGSGKDYSIEELAYLIGKLMGHKKIKILIEKERLRRFDVNRFCCDNRKLKKYTNWKPQVSLEEGMKKTIKWYNAHGRWSWEAWSDGVKFYQR